MYAERLGSYSIAATLAGTPSLRRLKSILRYRRLAPPPRWREVTRPYELRPPVFLVPSTSERSGSVRVTSSKSDQVANRRPGLVGLCFLRGITRQSLRRARSNRPRAAARRPSSTHAYDRRSRRGASASSGR